MVTERSVDATDGEEIARSIQTFVQGSIKTEVTRDYDLFGSGLVSSMFAMQLVVHLEEAYDLEIVGPELKLDNFRTVNAMTGLVQRLHVGADARS